MLPPVTLVRAGERQLAVREWGSGEPLLLIHGLGMSSGLWKYQVEDFSPRYRMIAPDIRGFGASDRPTEPGSYALGQYVADMSALADALGVRRLHCLGTSMGGVIAQALALARPDLCRSLILVNTSARVRIPPDVLKSRVRALEDMSMADYGKLVSVQALAEGASDELKTWISGDIALNDRRAYTQVLTEGLSTFDTSADVASIAAPTLVIVGTEDRVIPPEQGEDLALRIPGARLEKIPGTGHICYSERPDVFNKLVLDFLAAQRGN
ncbi:MAG: alpha/beta fold hydrolase [Candidatus Binatia bacterium]